MRNVSLLWLTLIFAGMLCAAQGPQTIRATTSDGRQVLLKPDGTWSFAAQPPSAPSASTRLSKSPTATKKVSAPSGPYAVWIDPRHWSEKKNEKDNRVMLESADHKGFAMIISDAIPISTGSLKEVVLHNARQLDPNADIVKEERRIVNGREVLCLEMKAVSSKIPFTYYGYYFGGNAGNVQVVTFTIQNQFAPMKDQFTEFLNGLEINDTALPEIPTVETISVNDDRIKLSYDTKKWNPQPKDKDGRIRLSHSKGGGFVMVIPEALSIPMDSLTEIALNNVRRGDPNASIILREKRTVHGREVWCMKISAVISKIPFTYYGYYYSGKEGTVQVLTYTTADAFKDLEPDFTELLNSLEFGSGSGDKSGQ